MVAIITAILVLSFLVLLHEWGHFITAKRVGLLVEEFGFGFPPRLWSKRVGETTYSVNLFPFGGFVRIYGENPLGTEVSNKESNRAFYAKPVRTRAVILTAGIAMNFIVGILLLSLLLSLGVPAAITATTKKYVKDAHAEIVEVVSNSPAAVMHLRPGDTITALAAGGERVETADSAAISDFVAKHKGENITLFIQRGNEQLSLSALSRKNPPPGEGSLGIAMVDVGTLRYPWWESVFQATRLAADVSREVVVALGRVFYELARTGKIGGEVAGPIGIVKIAGEVAQLGLLKLLNFTALLSINLAVLNLLPFPALDGGRLLFLLIEKIRGKAVPRKLETYSHAAGMAILLALILLISIHDVQTLF